MRSFSPTAKRDAKENGGGSSVTATNNHTEQSIRVLVADPYPVVRQVLADLVTSEGNMSLAGQVGNKDEVLQQTAVTNPHVVIVDISSEGFGKLDLVEELHEQYPFTQIVVFTMKDDRIYAERALTAGAVGYVMKSEPTNHLIDAIESAAQREVYLSRRVMSSLLGKLARQKEPTLRFDIDRLTSREMDVFQLTGKGESAADVASNLSLGEKTVSMYRRRICKKLSLNTLSELRQFATRWMMASRHVR